MRLKQYQTIVCALVTISLMIIGISFLLGNSEKNIKTVFDFYNFTGVFTLTQLSLFSGSMFVVSAIFIISANFNTRTHIPAAVLLSCISLFTLITLFSSNRWIEALGGFPAIGSGQGIIKYFALLSISFYLLNHKKVTLRTHAILNSIPVLIVLYWIGGMKFTELEAQGIFDLVNTSPFMSWMYQLFSVQLTSNLIGVYDIIFATLLIISIISRKKHLAQIALLATGSVFVMTQTFLFTAQEAFSSETLITGLGLFLIKDIWFIANLIIINQYISTLIEKRSQTKSIIT